MRTRLICLVFILAAATAYAQPSLQDLQPFVGTFTCTGTAFASEMGPEHASRGTVTSKWVLNKKWLEVRYSETKTTANPHPFSVVAYWGYDPQTKKLVADPKSKEAGCRRPFLELSYCSTFAASPFRILVRDLWFICFRSR